MIGSSLRRFSPPWTVDEAEACFIIRDANGQALAYVYCKDERERLMCGCSNHVRPEMNQNMAPSGETLAVEKRAVRAELDNRRNKGRWSFGDPRVGFVDKANAAWPEPSESVPHLSDVFSNEIRSRSGQCSQAAKNC